LILESASVCSSTAEALLRELLAEVRAMRQAVEQRGLPSSLSRADRQLLARLLPAVIGAIGSAEFVASELLEHEARGLQIVCAGMTARKLGKLLARAKGTPIDGDLVQQAEGPLEVGAILWRVVQVPKGFKP
jgi:hypothetical protein